jgi:hypothetical protein
MVKGSRILVVAAALLVAACAAMQQQSSQPVRSDQGEFKNLKVLPQNITHDELVATMRGFSRALGKRCDACHAALPGETNKLDYASDAKDEKRNARKMILMTRAANTQFISKLEHEPTDTPDQVTCWTCHRGKFHPEAPPAAAPEQRPGA